MTGRSTRSSFALALTGALLLAPEATQAKPERGDTRPPLSLSVKLTESGPEAPFVVTVENTSGADVVVADDPKLVWFEVTRPGAEKPLVCRLSGSLFPQETSVAQRTLEAGEKLTHPVDPRFYCFGAELDDALVPTAQVTPHYGWPTATRTRFRRGQRIEEPIPDKAPFVARPDIEGTAVGPRKNVVGDPVVLGEAYAPWAPPVPGTEAEPEPTLEVARGSDAGDEMRVTATVKISNPTGQRLHLFVRRELLTFEVLTDGGPVACDSEPDDRNPDRRAFTAVPPGGSVSLTSRLVELCPRGTFARAGIYLLRAKLDMDADGAEQGLDAFTGTLESGRPARVRVQRTLQIVQNRPAARAGTPPAVPPGVLIPPPPVPVPAAAPPPPPPPPQ